MASRQRISTACEACRANKIRCQPSEQSGICQKCLSSKRECISRTAPRTRRSRRSKLEQSETQSEPLHDAPAASMPPPPVASATFSIDFEVPAQSEVDDKFETLRDDHARYIDNILPQEPESDPWQWASSSTDGLETPASSSTNSHSIQNLHTKPLFNLASAECLLASFRSMLDQLPSIVLPANASVSHLAKARPFVLLAILAAASGSKTLQGHSLYDEEFRKVLGLKFVAGGERSLELLQGILIYCSWYPFHLRPKNKQALQYIRMAGDIIHDMELDQEFPTGISGAEMTEDQLEGIRAYLAFHYTTTSFVLAWKRHKGLSMAFSSWTATCCDILERNTKVYGDSVLANLVRSTNAMKEASDLMQAKNETTQYQARLVLLGLEAQIKEIHARISPLVASSTVMRMQTIFANVYIQGGALLKAPRSTKLSLTGDSSLPPSADKLHNCVENVNKYLDLVLSLNQEALLGFSIVDWTRMVLVIVVAVRISFPLRECPEFDSTWARSNLRLQHFLDNMCSQTDLTPASKKVDVLSASRVVLQVVKERYHRQVLLHDAKLSDSAPIAIPKCPMMDGSLEQYFPIWDADYGKNTNAIPMGSYSSASGNDQIFHDLWATMTMGWASDSDFQEQNRAN